MKKALLVLTSLTTFCLFATAQDVGVGTASPSDKLDVQSTTGTSFVRVGSGDGSVVGINFDRTAGGSQNWGIHSSTVGVTDVLDFRAADAAFSGFTSLMRLFNTGALDIDALNNANVAIGDNALATTAKLHLHGLGTTDATNALLVENDADVPMFTIRDDGNIGVNVTNAANINAHFTVAADSSPVVYIGTDVGFNHPKSGQLWFQEDVSYSGKCGIGLAHDGDENKLYFVGACTAPDTLMTLDRGGDVGISTADPTATLHVDGSIRFESIDSMAYPQLLVRDVNGNIGYNDITGFSDNDWTTSGSDMYSAVSGNVGIGTPTPGAKLDVRGDAVFNEDQDNFDFRIEGDDIDDVFFVDASNNNIGIGEQAPSSSYMVHIEPGEKDRGIYMDHNHTESGTTYGIYMDIDNDYTGSANSYGVYSNLRRDGAADNVVYGAYLYGGNYQTGTGTKSAYGAYGYGYLGDNTVATNTTAYGTYGYAAGYANTTYGGYFYSNVSSPTNNIEAYGVYAEAIDAETNYGGYFIADDGTGTNNYGVYAVGSGATNNWAGYFDGLLEVDDNVYASGGDLYTSATDGVINAGGGIMSATGNYISDGGTPSTGIVDEELWVEGDLEIGGVAYKPGGGSWTATSDARLKKDVHPYEDGLSQVLSIKPVWYTYDETKLDLTNPGEEYVGVIAQDVLEVAPYMVNEVAFFEETKEIENGVDVVTKQGENYYTVDPSALTYMLINAVQEQQQQIEELKAELEELKNQ